MKVRGRAVRWWYPRPIAFLLGFALVALVALGSVPLVLSWRLEAAIARSLPGSPPVRANVTGVPTALVGGRFQRIDIEVRSATVGEVPVSRMTLRLNGVVLDTSRLIMDGALVISHIEGGRGEVEITEEDLKRFLVEKKDVRNPTVSFTPNRVTVEADVRVLGADLRVRLEGSLVVSSPTTVDLRLHALSIGTFSVAGDLGNTLAAAVNPVVRLQGLPVPARIESVVIEKEIARVVLRVDKR